MLGGGEAKDVSGFRESEQIGPLERSISRGPEPLCPIPGPVTQPEWHKVKSRKCRPHYSLTFERAQARHEIRLFTRLESDVNPDTIALILALILHLVRLTRRRVK